MKAEAWRRVRAAFEHAVGLAADERSAWLDDTVGVAGALRAEVERLLAAEKPGSNFLASPLADPSPAAPHIAGPYVGRRFGSFQIQRLIAAGGMGAVYEAEQENPRRRVALKLMRTGLATESARRRFDDEVDLLARLRHPAIAQIYDAGVRVEGTGDARLETPWFALELVDGARSIVAYAEAEALGVHARLNLFRAACTGVHHGHQMGVLHRDLKPANLLVDRGGHPKVIDFGVAKALNPGGPVVDERTRAGEIVGTLVTMSPEQIAGRREDVDIRADVYSLGVVLYQLLSGRAPFDIEGLSLTQAGRLLLDDEPPPPSRHRPTLPHDLDRIVAKAMAKERERRYDSVAEFSEDLGRFLRHEPVSAGPPGAFYPLRKFVRRHRAAVSVSILLVLAVLGGLVGTTLGLMRARSAELVAKQAEAAAQGAADAARAAEAEAQRERAAAVAEANRATAVTDFLVEVLAAPRPAVDGRDVRVVDVLASAASLDGVRFADQPDIRARLSGALGAVYHGLGLEVEAEREHRASLEVLRRLHPGDHADTARELRRLGLVLTQSGRFDEAAAVLRDAVAMEERLGGGRGLHRARAQLGRLALARSDLGGAERILRTAVRGLEATLGAAAQETLLAVNSLAGVLHQGGRLAEAEPLYVRARAGLAELVPADHPDLVRVRFNLAMLAHSQGRTDEAIAGAREVLEIYTRILGPEHPDTLLVTSNLCGMLQLAGRADEAAPIYAGAIESARDSLPADHPVLLTMSANLGMLAKEAGDLALAEDLFLRVYDVRRASLGEGHESTLRTLFDLAELAFDQGARELALERVSSGLELARTNLGERHFFVYRYQLLLGQYLTAEARFDEAEAVLLESVRSYELAPAAPTPLIAPDAALRELYEVWGRPARADEEG